MVSKMVRIPHGVRFISNDIDKEIPQIDLHGQIDFSKLVKPFPAYTEYGLSPGVEIDGSEVNRIYRVVIFIQDQKEPVYEGFAPHAPYTNSQTIDEHFHAFTEAGDFSKVLNPQYVGILQLYAAQQAKHLKPNELTYRFIPKRFLPNSEKKSGLEFVLTTDKSSLPRREKSS